jgi:hypothetical protein
MATGSGLSPRLRMHRQLLTTFCFLLLTSPTLAFDREDCFRRVSAQLHNNISMALDTVLFRKIPASLFNPILTLEGCYELCDKHATIYNDIGPRLATWLIPTLFLLANLQFAPIGKERFLAVVHVLGDPIDSMFSLLSKLEVWNRCYFRAEKFHQQYPRDILLPGVNLVKNLAMIFSAIEETMGPLSTFDDPLELFLSLFGERAPNHSDFEVICSRSAGELADVRIKEMRRTWLSVGLYLFGVIAAFIPKISGEITSLVGGRIAFAMLLSPLLPNVLLSNTIGDFVNRRESLRKLISFQKALKESEPHRHDCNSDNSSNVHQEVLGARSLSVASSIELVPAPDRTKDQERYATSLFHV